MVWNLDDGRAIYTQLIELVERAIVTGEYPPGAKLPGVRELAGEAGVNPNTMQRALAELEARGLVFSQRTSGRFVTEDAARIARLREELARALTADYLQRMRALGCSEGEIERYVRAVKEEL